jgi:hypothetical protein
LIWKNFQREIFSIFALNSRWSVNKMNQINNNENCELVSAGEAVSFSSLVLVHVIAPNGEEEKSAGPQWAGEF